MWASDLHMDFVLQRRFALDAKVPGDLRDQLSLFPVREDAIDVLTGNSSHGGKVGFPEVLSDYDTAALYRLTEMLREFDQVSATRPLKGRKLSAAITSLVSRRRDASTINK